MNTISHEVYLALNEVQRNQYLSKKRIPLFDIIKSKGWIERNTAFDDFPEAEDEWELTSAGRLEHNIYEKTNGLTDGCKKKVNI